MKKNISFFMVIFLSLIASDSAFGAFSQKDKGKDFFPDSAFIDKTGKIVFKLEKDSEANKFSDGLVAIKIGDSYGKGSFFDKSGKAKTKEFQRLESFSEGLARVGSSSKYGFTDTSGNLVIPEIFQDADDFHEGLAAVKINGKGGFVDKTGKFVIDPFYKQVAAFSCGLAAAEGDGKVGFLDKNGKWAIKPQFKGTNGFSEDLALVSNDDESFYIDTQGKIVLKLDKDWTVRNETNVVSYTALYAAYNSVWRDWGISRYYTGNSSFHEGLAVMGKGGKCGFIDKSGKFVIEPQFDFALSFSEGLAQVCIGKKAGFINKKGEYVVKPTYRMAESFHDGMATVALDHQKWGFIDKTGKLVIAPKFIYAWSFSEGLAQVQLNGWRQDGICDE